jgi:hypothetical protein
MTYNYVDIAAAQSQRARAANQQINSTTDAAIQRHVARLAVLKRNDTEPPSKGLFARAIWFFTCPFER